MLIQLPCEVTFGRNGRFTSNNPNPAMPNNDDQLMNSALTELEKPPECIDRIVPSSFFRFYLPLFSKMQ